MPRYRFEFFEEEAIDPVWVDLADVDAARAQAIETARLSMIDGLSEGHDPTRWATKIYDEAGYLLMTITFADILEK